MGKKKYKPCQLEVVSFRVERGFAGSFEGTIDQNNAMSINFIMNSGHNGGVRNEQYTNAWEALENYSYDSDLWE